MLQIDFGALRAGKASYNDLTKSLTYADLRAETNELFSTIQAIIANVSDADVTLVPEDPQAGEGEHGWTLGHVIAHLTASLEEGAASAALLTRGFAIEQRLHTETPWESITTVEQLQARLHESQRITNAYLEAWPDKPDLTTTTVRVPFLGPMNAIGSYALGLVHGEMHYEQLKEIMRQAKKA
ncbi:DinB family protein [Dictyobacter kobayashii]|uniref:DinB-like domain-containing protein n=1 Tax=Dictyobacter kobayashii TaxID=2014872 RepID=A0A402AUZ3_9CHLR|nr:DinB family protein [Dictyobacter kobayashii]GCE22879.1 hypothetical protein KDK_66790 [Dictyobacter kobayashii]